MSRTSARRRTMTVAAAASSLALLLSGCADFTEQAKSADAGSFTSVPPGNGPGNPPPPPPPTEGDDNGMPPPEGPCVDPDPTVIATCLDTTSGVRPANQDGSATYVAERTTGKIFVSKRYGPQRLIATIPVEAGGDGGLIDFEMSPTYQEDQMIYALITTAEDNRVVRVAPGDSVKPVLTGIPKGETGNMGSISFASPTELRVATGDAGSGDGLAGKLFTIDPNHVDPKPDIIARGLGSNVSLCPDAESGKLYVADSGPAGDRLQQVEAGGLRTLWTWGDRPGVTGCAVSGGVIAVSMAGKFRIDSMMAPTNSSPTVGQPAESDIKKKYGAVARMTPSGGAMQIATVNKSTPGAPSKTFNDRVAVYMPSAKAEDNT